MANEEKENTQPQETVQAATTPPVAPQPDVVQATEPDTNPLDNDIPEAVTTASPDEPEPTTDPVEVSTPVADSTPELPVETAETEIVPEPEPVSELAAVAEPAAAPITEPQTSEEPVAEPQEEAQPAEAQEEPDGEAVAEPEPMAEPGAVTEQEDLVAPAEPEPVSAQEPVAEVSAEQPESDTAGTPIPEEFTAQYVDDVEEPVAQAAADYSHFSKQDFVNLLSQQAEALKAEKVNPGDFKRADELLKATKPLFDQLKQADRQAALAVYQQESESEDGFQYTYDETVQQFDAVYKQIKSQKNSYFQNLDKAKDTNFSAKTDLLRRLRELVESDETNAGDAKTSWNEFKKIQDEWKAAGNLNSPHNATLWATYHALADRYYNNRNIYFELKDLDRKKNVTLKTEVIEKVEALAQAHADKAVTRQTIETANALFEEYKHIGPAPKTEQEALWQRMKLALDALYDKRRGQTEDQRKESAQLYEEKSRIYEELIPLTSFSSGSINDWNDKTKAVMALQDQWNAIKGSMPREEGKELSKKFWGALKTFFNNKGEFFRQLELKREQNLQLKTQLCEQVESLLESGDESPEITQRVIELQKQWKNIGQVPEKQKNTIFDRFKKACDAFFNRKRNKNQETEREFEDNLTRKNDLIARIEAAANQSADLSVLNVFKQEWNSIGFVPKKDMQGAQKRYIAAINALVSANGKLSDKEKEKAMQDNATEATRPGGRSERSGGGNRDRSRGDRNSDSRADRGSEYRGSGRSEGSGGGDSKRESDLRRRISSIENDIATYRNNIEFFARSKNADAIRADIDRKIADATKQMDDLRRQLREVQG